MTPAQLVFQLFPGKTMIPMIDAGATIGYKRQTTYNLHATGKFPLRVKKIGGHTMVALSDLINYLEDRPQQPEEPEQFNVTIAPTLRRRRGRPTKKEQIERQRQAV